MLLLRPYYGVTNPGVISHGVAPRWSQNTVLILLHGLLIRASYLERPRYVNAMFLSAANSGVSFLPITVSSQCLLLSASPLTV